MLQLMPTREDKHIYSQINTCLNKFNHVYNQLILVYLLSLFFEYAKNMTPITATPTPVMFIGLRAT